MPRIEPKADANVPMDINIFKTMAVSPTFMEGFLAFNKTVSGGTLSEELREKIALTAAGKNGCDYCKAAHSKMAAGAGISEGGIEYALQGKCGDAKIDAALKFVTALIEKRGHIDDADFNAVKDAGYSDQEIIDIFGQTMVNIVTNYFNDFVQTDIDL
jgi:AhpD family alkylhydroperoxidase